MCNQNFVKGVSYSASKNSQKNDLQQTKWLSFLTSNLTMTLFFNFWPTNFNMKPLSRNHPCYGASCLITLDAPWSINKQVNALTSFAWFPFNNILCPSLHIVPRQSTFSIFVNFVATNKTLQYNIICYKQLLYCILN